MGRLPADPITTLVTTLGADCNFAHVQPTGEYHYHGNPSALMPPSRPACRWAGWRTAPHLRALRLRDGHGEAIHQLAGSYRVREGERLARRRRHAARRVRRHLPARLGAVDGLGDLDTCNGRAESNDRRPHVRLPYYLTHTYPFMPRCLMGEPAAFAGGGEGGGGQGPGRRRAMRRRTARARAATRRAAATASRRRRATASARRSARATTTATRASAAAVRAGASRRAARRRAPLMRPLRRPNCRRSRALPRGFAGERARRPAPRRGHADRVRCARDAAHGRRGRGLDAFDTNADGALDAAEVSAQREAITGYAAASLALTSEAGEPRASRSST